MRKKLARTILYYRNSQPPRGGMEHLNDSCLNHSPLNNIILSIYISVYNYMLGIELLPQVSLRHTKTIFTL